MKLKPNPNSKRTFELEDRAYHRAIGKRYPITMMSARKFAKMAKAMHYEYLSTICPN